MNNTVLDALKINMNYTRTQNGAVAHKTTLNKIYDMFALGGAYRNRSDNDCLLLFKNAYMQDPKLALKCLFYLRDVRGGQGERRFFRLCFKWLANNYTDVARANINNIIEYGRYDDLYCLFGTNLEGDMLNLIKKQLIEDIELLQQNQPVSLLAKWLKSENTYSKESKKIASKIRESLGLTKMKYRKTLSALRKQINIVERLMSANDWDNIQFNKLPSKAGLIYRNAFAHREETKERYADFINSKETKVNARTLYPYEIVHNACKNFNYWNYNIDESDAAALEKYWTNLPDYFNEDSSNIMCVVDTSGSMTSRYGNSSVQPIDVAISLGMYCAERNKGAFQNHFISFSSRPQLIEIEGVNFVDKAWRIYKQNLCEDTDLTAVFKLLKDIAQNPNTNKKDLPKTIVVISDMEINEGSYWRSPGKVQTEMERIRNEWAEADLEMPHLVYWNVNAAQNLILDNDEATYVSGCSPVIFQTIISGKTGIEFMLEILNGERYAKVTIN